MKMLHLKTNTAQIEQHWLDSGWDCSSKPLVWSGPDKKKAWSILQVPVLDSRLCTGLIMVHYHGHNLFITTNMAGILHQLMWKKRIKKSIIILYIYLIFYYLHRMFYFQLHLNKKKNQFVTTFKNKLAKWSLTVKRRNVFPSQMFDICLFLHWSDILQSELLRKLKYWDASCFMVLSEQQ